MSASTHPTNRTLYVLQPCATGYMVGKLIWDDMQGLRLSALHEIGPEGCSCPGAHHRSVCKHMDMSDKHYGRLITQDMAVSVTKQMEALLKPLFSKLTYVEMRRAENTDLANAVIFRGEGFGGVSSLDAMAPTRIYHSSHYLLFFVNPDGDDTWIKVVVLLENFGQKQAAPAPEKSQPQEPAKEATALVEKYTVEPAKLLVEVPLAGRTPEDFAKALASVARAIGAPGPLVHAILRWPTSS